MTFWVGSRYLILIYPAKTHEKIQFARHLPVPWSKEIFVGTDFKTSYEIRRFTGISGT